MDKTTIETLIDILQTEHELNGNSHTTPGLQRAIEILTGYKTCHREDYE